MDDYDDFYISRRVKSDESIGFLSAGLKAVPILLNYGKKRFPDLITYTNNSHIMGGSYLWKWEGETTTSTSGSILPVYSNPQYIGEMQLFPIIKQDGTIVKDYFFGLETSFITIFHRISENVFEPDEMRSELFGAGLFDAGIQKINVSKILVRDFTGNGHFDLIVGENDWTEYHPRIDGKPVGWGSEHYVPFDKDRNYQGGPVHGRVHLFRGLGLFNDDDEPLSMPEGVTLDNISIEMVFGDISDNILEEEPEFHFAYEGFIDGVDVYGYSTPSVSNFRTHSPEKDKEQLEFSKLDLVTGNFIRDITYFKQKPNLTPSKDSLKSIFQFESGIPIFELRGVINSCISYDLNHSGLPDLIIGSENGHIYFVENSGTLMENGIPKFYDPISMLQTNPPLKSDILPVPSVGALREGHLDIVCGNGAGLFDYFKDYNPLTKSAQWQNTMDLPRILPPLPGGSIQGPTEIGWGYICSKLFDWTENGLLDIVFSDINGDHQVAVNHGSKANAIYREYTPIFEESTNQPLQTVWRVKPAIVNLSDFAKNQNIKFKHPIRYLCLDEKGYVVMFCKNDEFTLGDRTYPHIAEEDKTKLTKRFGGSLGRVKFTFVDWNNNGKPDLLLGVPGSHNFEGIVGNEDAGSFPNSNMAVMLNTTENLDDLVWSFKGPRYLYHKDKNRPIFMGNHTCAPEPFVYDGTLYLIVGTEDGQFYQFQANEFEIR